MTITQRIAEWGIERGINSNKPDFRDYTVNIIEELNELAVANKNCDLNEMIDAIADIIVFSITELTKYKGNPDAILEETLKEISSRTGAFNADYGKWMKDTSPEAKAKWYKANYLPLIG